MSNEGKTHAELIAGLGARVTAIERLVSAPEWRNIPDRVAFLENRASPASSAIDFSAVAGALQSRMASIERHIGEMKADARAITKGELVDGKPLRSTCLHDNGDGSFSLTLLVDVRGEDIVEAADLLKRGRALQAAADYKGAPGDDPDDILMCGRCGAFGNVSTGDMANVSRRYTKDRVVTDATCQKCWRTSGMASLP